MKKKNWSSSIYPLFILESSGGIINSYISDWYTKSFVSCH